MDFPVILLVIGFVVVTFLLVAAWDPTYFGQKLRSLKRGDDSSDRTNQPANIPKSERTPILPNMSFEDVMQGSSLVQGMSDNMMNELNSSLNITSLASGDALIKGVEYVKERNECIVKFSKEGQKMLGSKKASLVKSKSGKLMPQLRGKGGEFMEHSEIASKGRKALSNLSKVSTLAVSAAHMISSADMAKKLDDIDEKLNYLIADRENERQAELEAVYKTAREIIIENEGDVTPEQLRNLTYKLYKIRANWRENLKYKLNAIDNSENESFWKRTFTSFQKGRDQRIYNQISSCFQELKMINKSLNLHLALSYESNSLPNFQTNALSEEIKADQDILNHLREKASYISGEKGIHDDREIEYFENHIGFQKALQVQQDDNEIVEIEFQIN